MTDCPRHIVLAPDSYKGSASAQDVAGALRDGLAESVPGARFTLAPMADGGEGTLDCVAAVFAGRWEQVRIPAIHGRTIDARWYRTGDGRAVIESAEVLGLPLIQKAGPDAPPLHARTSAALGALIAAVLDTGIHELFIGLGGSACNDAGLGLLMALGAKATDKAGQGVAPTLDGLLELDALDLSGIDPRLSDTTLHVLCDVDNPLLGMHGSSRVYGPQKGLTETDIEAVEAAFARLAENAAAPELATAAGSGAAGGLGFALAMLGGKLAPGAQTLIAMTGLRGVLESADLVITGEGRSDRQTLAGKLPLAIAQAAAPVPTVLVAGAIADDARDALERTFAGCYTLVERAGSTHAALADPLHWIRHTAAAIGQDIERLRVPG